MLCFAKLLRETQRVSRLNGSDRRSRPWGGGPKGPPTIRVFPPGFTWRSLRVGDQLKLVYHEFHDKSCGTLFKLAKPAFQAFRFVVTRVTPDGRDITHPQTPSQNTIHKLCLWWFWGRFGFGHRQNSFAVSAQPTAERVLIRRIKNNAKQNHIFDVLVLGFPQKQGKSPCSGSKINSEFFL